MSVINEKKCFVIMPFGDTINHTQQYWTNHFENFLKKFLEEKFRILRVSRSEPIGGSILDRILFDITQSDIVIADITDFNPNVIWELGIRNSFRHGTIIIAEKGTELPFDLKDMGVLFYDFGEHPYSQDINDFFEKLEKVVIDCLENPMRTDSPILEAIPRGIFFELVKKQENLRKISAIIIECDDNLQILKDALEMAKANQKIRKGDIEGSPVFFTSRARIPALETLMVNQYLTEDEQFYRDTATCLHNIKTNNDQFVSWEYNSHSTEIWLIKNLPGAIDRLNRFKEKIIQVQQKLVNQS